MAKDITFEGARAVVDPRAYNKVEVTVEDADEDAILDSFTIQDVIKHYGERDLLDAIGEDEAKEYWGLKDAAE